MAEMDPEEARLVAAMEKKSNEAFEKQRREALAKAQREGKVTKNFQLSDEPNAGLKRTLSTSTQVRHHDLPSEQHAAAAQAYHPAPTPADPPAASGLELSKYMEQQAARDREFRERHEAAEREKQAALAGFGSSLSKYEEQARQRDLEAKRNREEEEKRRQEEMTATAAKLKAYKDKQAAEEAEFRRKREEAERQKQDQLNAMRAADEQRRQAALQREAETKRTAAPAPVAKANVCATCQKEFPDKSLVNVKGRMYCYGCSIAAQADPCYGCSKPIISGAFMKANGRKYHPECLVCNRCKKQLNEGFRMRGKEICCVPCSSKP